MDVLAAAIAREELEVHVDEARPNRSDHSTGSTPRSAFLLALLAHAAVWITSFVLWPRLPARFPVHFDLAGHPDRFAERSWLAFFALAAIAAFLSVLLLGIARSIEWLATKHPSWINTPGKEQFLALDPARRRRAVQPVQQTLVSVVMLLNGLFLYIIVGTERVANGAWATLPSWPVFVFVALVITIAIFHAIAAHRAVQQLSLEG